MLRAAFARPHPPSAAHNRTAFGCYREPHKLRGIFPGEAYTHTNPINALFAIGPNPIIQIIIACGFIENGLNKGKLTQLDMFDDPKRVPGEFGWDPLKLGTPENKEMYQARELENGRLAMIAIGGMIHGTFVTGEGVFGSTF